MQNISKALIMVGSVILGVILLSTLIRVLKMGGDVNKRYDETQQTYQTEAFNYQYEVYQRDDNTIMDIVTLFNLAYTTNSENDYNLNNSIIITVKIGNKTYQIPKDLSNNSETFHNNNAGVLKRNQISDSSGNVMSIYDLLEKSIGDLGISGFTSEDKLNKIHIGEYIYYSDRTVDGVSPGSPIIGKDEGTTYKYVFDCNDSSITYNKNTGRISKMEFECKLNPNWNLANKSGVNWDNE